MKEINIFVIAHKKIEKKLSDIYIPIQVGNADSLGYLRDNTGDNITHKNSNYCELTGMYWTWKNYELAKFVGICHYRRFFSQSSFRKNTILQEENIKKIMKDYDIILPKKFYFDVSVWENYFKNGQGKEKDLITTKEIIAKLYPEYLECFNTVLNQKSGHYCNMMIMSKENYCKYSEWLFDILAEVEKSTDLAGYTKEEARIYGYISELLLNVWVKQNNLRVKECSMVKTDSKQIERIKGFLRKIYNKYLLK